MIIHIHVAVWPITTCCAAVADGRFRGKADCCRSSGPVTIPIYARKSSIDVASSRRIAIEAFHFTVKNMFELAFVVLISLPLADQILILHLLREAAAFRQKIPSRIAELMHSVYQSALMAPVDVAGNAIRPAFDW